jgi:hypothetical protein
MNTGYRERQWQRGIYRKETGWTESGGKLWEPEGIEGCYKTDDDDVKLFKFLFASDNFKTTLRKSINNFLVYLTYFRNKHCINEFV